MLLHGKMYHINLFRTSVKCYFIDVFLLFLYLALFGFYGSSLLYGHFTSCGEWASHCCGFPCARAQTQGLWASVIAAHGLSS